MIDGVVLDLDGTLLDTEALYRRAFTAELAAEDLTILPALYASLVGLPTEERGAARRRHFGPGLPWQRCLGRYYEIRARLLADGVPLKPGAVELLRWAAARGPPMAIATSASLLASRGWMCRSPCCAKRDDGWGRAPRWCRREPPCPFGLRRST